MALGRLPELMCISKVLILEQFFFMWNTSGPKSLRKLPRLYETEDVEIGEKVIYLHFFVAGSDWFIAEYDGEDTFFGFACLNGLKEFAEWGYISFQELKDLKVKQPILLNGKRKVIYLEVECDVGWEIRKAKDVELIRECQNYYIR